MLRTIALRIGGLCNFFGRAFLELSRIMNRVNRSRIVQKGEGRDLYRTRFGDLFWLDRNNYVDQCIIGSGLFEERSTEIARRLVKPGATVLDVGANIGYYTTLLARLVGENGRVIAFEPTEYYGNVLRKNLEANRIVNVELHPLGLSDRDQVLDIQIGGSTATLHHPGVNPLERSERIRLTTLDDFVASQGLTRIDFIKVDVDGHEPLFLRGARKTLAGFDPLILMEVSHLHYLEAGFTAWDFYASLKEDGYRIFHENDLAEIRSRDEFLIKCGNFAYSTNVIITRKELPWA